MKNFVISETVGGNGTNEKRLTPCCESQQDPGSSSLVVHANGEPPKPDERYRPDPRSARQKVSSAQGSREIVMRLAHIVLMRMIANATHHQYCSTHRGTRRDSTNLQVIDKVDLEILVRDLDDFRRLRRIVVHGIRIEFVYEPRIPDQTVIVACNIHSQSAGQLSEHSNHRCRDSPSRSPPPSIFGKSRSPLTLNTITFRR